MASRRAAALPRKPEGRYHHGDLREALLAAAAAVVEREGVAALSLRDLARRLGVSHAAPAHHFPDRNALVAELAREGFERLAAAMTKAAEGEHYPLLRLRRTGEAYVAFALAHTGFFRVMFGREVSDLAAPAALAAAGGRAFGVLRSAVQEVLAGWPPGKRPDAEQVAFACWTIVHGAATLWIDGPLRCREPRGAEREQFERGFAFTLDLLGPALAPPRGRGAARLPPA